MENIDKANKSKEDNFYKQSFFIFIASLIMNATGYFFHFFVGRILGPASYGIIGSLLTILYIINVPFNTIQTTIAKFTANLNSNNDNEAIKYLLVSSLKKIFLLSSLTFIIYLILSKLISNFLNIDQLTPIIMMGILIIIALLLSVMWGIIQGLQMFKSLGISMITEGFVKLKSTSIH